MRKILILLLLAFILSGCATYKFQKSVSSGSQGYLVTYDGEPILEYTVGKEKSLPDLDLAKQRFQRRKITVERYYKQMGQIEPRLKEFFWEPPMMFLDFLVGILRWPFTAITDYKYHHDPKYKEKADKLDDERDASEKARVNSLKEKLNIYIADDLAKEPLASAGSVETVVMPKVFEPEKIEPPKVEIPAAKEDTSHALTIAPIPQAQPVPPEIKAVPAETTAVKAVPVEPAAVKADLESPVAVIIAKPEKGYSPLVVKFSGKKSFSKNGRIIAYNWDFGDGSASTKKNPENTYWSTTFGKRNFTVTLTVRDTEGLSSSATSTIEVSTP